MYTKLTIKEEIRILEQMKEDKVDSFLTVKNKIEAKNEINYWILTDSAENILYKLGDYRKAINDFYNTNNMKINIVKNSSDALSYLFSGIDFRYFPVIMKSENGKIVDANYWDGI